MDAYELWGERDDGTRKLWGRFLELADAQRELADLKRRGLFRRLWIA